MWELSFVLINVRFSENIWGLGRYMANICTGMKLLLILRHSMYQTMGWEKASSNQSLEYEFSLNLNRRRQQIYLPKLWELCKIFINFSIFENIWNLVMYIANIWTNPNLLLILWKKIIIIYIKLQSLPQSNPIANLWVELLWVKLFEIIYPGIPLMWYLAWVVYKKVQ